VVSAVKYLGHDAGVPGVLVLVVAGGDDHDAVAIRLHKPTRMQEEDTMRKSIGSRTWTEQMTIDAWVLTAMAGGRPPRTSPRPPVLLQGAISAPTKTTFMPAAAQTTREGSLPPPRCGRRDCCRGAARALVRTLSAPAEGRGPLRPWTPRRNMEVSPPRPKPAWVVASWDVARAAMPTISVEAD